MGAALLYLFYHNCPIPNLSVSANYTILKTSFGMLPTHNYSFHYYFSSHPPMTEAIISITTASKIHFSR